MANGISIDVVHIYEGFSDYWQGDGDRWDENKGCLFAYYGPDTTYRDLVDGWLEDFNSGGDFDGKPLAEEVTEAEMRKALEDLILCDRDAVIEAAGCLEDFDAENSESPISVVLVTLETDETEEDGTEDAYDLVDDFFPENETV